MQLWMIGMRNSICRLIAVVLFLTNLPAYAQSKTYEDKLRDDARRERQDETYKSTIQRIPAQGSARDPWGIVRPENPKPSPPSRQKKPQAH